MQRCRSGRNTDGGRQSVRRSRPVRTPTWSAVWSVAPVIGPELSKGRFKSTWETDRAQPHDASTCAATAQHSKTSSRGSRAADTQRPSRSRRPDSRADQLRGPPGVQFKQRGARPDGQQNHFEFAPRSTPTRRCGWALRPSDRLAARSTSPRSPATAPLTDEREGERLHRTGAASCNCRTYIETCSVYSMHQQDPATRRRGRPGTR